MNRICRHYILLLGLLCGVPQTVFAQLSFEPPTSYHTENKSASTALALGDFNKDGFVDIAIGHDLSYQATEADGVRFSTQEPVRLLINDGNGDYSLGADISTGEPLSSLGRRLGPITLLAFDVDGDGDEDLVGGLNGYPYQLDRVQSSISTMINDGLGNFAEGVLSARGTVNPWYIQKIALPGDLLPDLAVLSLVNSGPGPVLLMSNSGVITSGIGPFTTLKTLESSGTAMAVADFDGDQILDVAIAGDRSLIIHFLDANNNSTRVVTPFPADVPRFALSIIAGDFNGDQKVDVAALSLGTTTKLTVFSNQGRVPMSSSTITAPTVSIGTQQLPAILTAGDLEGDMDLDIWYGRFATSAAGVLMNDGVGNFSPLGEVPICTVSDPVHVARTYYCSSAFRIGHCRVDSDLNGDSVNDLACLLGGDGGSLRLGISLQGASAAVVAARQAQIDGLEQQNDYLEDENDSLSALVTSLKKKIRSYNNAYTKCKTAYKQCRSNLAACRLQCQP